ncbi:DUF6932 family protein [Pedobacter jeongneungensis]|uniref:DUF6932 family protein n=1 Tax=Pedobacter jeongneungensis TaxID=947309 RepID=UPI000469DC9C|nr:hypothetical protein [Pedobacter jeongneungensis]
MKDKIMTEHECNVLIDSKRTQYGLVFENEEHTLEELYEFLHSLEIYSHLQYRFYCWLGLRLKKDIKVNFPFTPAATPYILDAFKTKFLNSDRKRILFDSFQNYLKRLKKKEGVDAEIQVLIGGSFLVLDNQMPNDLDLAVLVPEVYRHKNSFDYHPFAEPIPTKIEIKFMPENYSTDTFFGYSWISHLGSNAVDKTKGAKLSQNYFEVREIALISL